MSVIKTKTLDRNIIFISAPEITSGDENNNTIAILLDSSWMIQDAEYYITFFTTDEEDGIIKKLDVQDRLCVCSVPDKTVANEGSFYFGLFAKAPDGTVKTSAIASYAVHKGIITDSEGEDTLSMLAVKNKFISLINSNTYDALLSPEMDFENEIDPTFTNYMSNLHLADYKYTSIVESLFEIIKKFIDTDAEKIDDPDFAPLIYYLIVYEYVKNASSQVSSDSTGDDLDPISSPNQELLTSLQNDVEAALSNLNTLANRVYSYTHSAVVTDDLEKDYQDIITSNPDLENVSAVGLLAILKNGDTVTAQGNRLFINGTEEQSDYSFSGENSENGIEVVKIWYFQNGESQLTLQENFDYIIISANVRQIETVNINASYLNYLNLITIDGGFVPSANSIIKTVVDNYGINARLPKSVETYYSTRLQTGGSKNENTIFTNLDTTYKIKTVYLPELETISSTSFWQNQVIENIYCPKLKTIANSMWNAAFYAPFSNCPNLIFTIPNSCEVISVSVSVDGNSSCFYDSIKGIILDCKDAVISDLWCQSLSSISIFEMCSDWGASINISKPAGLAKWSMTKYIDLMTNKLRDMTVTEKTRTLTIPSAMLTAMQADTDGLAAIEAATDKGWTIGGA